MEGLQALERTIATTLSPDNDARRLAEEALVQAEAANPIEMIEALTRLLRHSGTPEVRHASAVRLRQRLMSGGDDVLMGRLAPEQQESVRRSLLETLVHEPMPFLKRQVADTITEIAKVIGITTPWPELFEFLFTASSARTQANGDLRHVCFVIMHKLADTSPDVLIESVSHCADAYTAGLQDPVLGVRVQAAVASIIHSCSMDQDELHTQVFQTFLPGWMGVLTETLSGGHNAESLVIMQALNEVAADYANFFAPRIDDVADLMLQVGQATQLDGSLRKVALVWFVNVCVCDPSLVRRSPRAVRNGVAVALSLMLMVEEEPNWEHGEEPILERSVLSDSSLFDAGDDALERIAGKVKRKTILPVLTPIIERFVQNESWKFRFVGVHALCAASPLMKLHEVPVEQLCNFLHDPHPRVVVAALQCLAVICTDFAGEYHEAHHATVVPRVLDLVARSPLSRVRTHAGHVMFGFIEDGPGELANVYFDAIMEAMLEAMKAPSRALMAACMLCMAALAGRVPELFHKYYQHVMPAMMRVVVEATGRDDAPLRARAMEAVTFVGMGVGRNAFREDARRLMAVFLDMMQRGQVAPDSPVWTYMFNAWARLCTILRDEFVPYLPHTMPHILAMAAIPVDGMYRKLMSAEQAAESGGADVRNNISVSSKQLEASIEDKVTGINMMSTILGVLAERALYLPFLADTVRVVLPSVGNHMSPELRDLALNCVPDIVKCALEAVQHGHMALDEARGLFNVVSQKLTECLSTEKDMVVLMSVVTAVKECVGEVGSERAVQWLDPGMLRGLSGALLKILQKSIKRVMSRDAERAKGQLDEEALDDLNSYDETESHLAFLVSECVSTMLRVLGAHFLPVFEELYPGLLEMSAESAPRAAQVTACFIFDDVVEHCGPASARYFEQLMPLFLRNILSEKYELRQAAAYGLGSCAARTGQHFTPYADETIKRLLAACQMPMARKARHASATDNSVGALGKVIRYQNRAELVPVWLGLLPITEDAEEGPHVYGMLMDLLEAGNEALLGPGMQNLPRIINVLLHVHNTEFVDAAVNARMEAAIRSVASMKPADRDSLVRALPAESQEMLAQKLAATPAAAQTQ